MRAARLSLAILAVCHVAYTPIAGQDREPDERAGRRRLHIEDGRDHRVHHRRSDVDVGRRLARRPHDRLRPARRPLHAADRRRRGHAHHRRPVVREPAHVVARRQDASRFSPIAPASRTCGSPTPTASNPRAVSKDTKTNDRPQIMVSPAWTPDGQYIVVSKSRPPDPGTFWLFMYHRDGGTGVRVGARAAAAAVARRAPGPPPPPPPNRMGAVVSPDGRFIYYTQRTGTFTYNARFPLWQIYRHDRETGDVIAGDQRAGQRHASGALARRQVAGLRHAPQDRRPACASATSRPAPSAGWPIRSRATIRNRAPAATRCRATTSCPTASRSSCRSAASCSASTSPPARRRRFRSPRRCRPRSRRASTRRCASTTGRRCARG